MRVRRDRVHGRVGGTGLAEEEETGRKQEGVGERTGFRSGGRIGIVQV